MGNDYKTNIQLVISHQEGSAGNFLARLYANLDLYKQTAYRTDLDLHPLILATGDINNLNFYLKHHYNNHSVIVTHCQDLKILEYMFPEARILQIYPYSHIGNVLYNISTKKLKPSIHNLVDNHLIHITEWFSKIEKNRPLQQCIDYWELTNKEQVEKILGINFDLEQDKFFKKYWASQLAYDLNWPAKPMSIQELIDFWKLDVFDAWFVAWTIFVFEKTHNLKEKDRQWSIDQTFESWDQVKTIEHMYANNIDTCS